MGAREGEEGEGSMVVLVGGECLGGLFQDWECLGGEERDMDWWSDIVACKLLKVKRIGVQEVGFGGGGDARCAGCGPLQDVGVYVMVYSTIRPLEQVYANQHVLAARIVDSVYVGGLGQPPAIQCLSQGIHLSTWAVTCRPSRTILMALEKLVFSYTWTVAQYNGQDIRARSVGADGSPRAGGYASAVGACPLGRSRGATSSRQALTLCVLAGGPQTPLKRPPFSLFPCQRRRFMAAWVSDVESVHSRPPIG
ncbi:hypothetical protein COCMIDRAFT_30220 [Bipolaris oryzae ATCC 44560]|uniref:Uncharacterized protein n=1 Tax=Bipolaris oryzae ATCC 44560 TaxID=930090 RepID=W6ZB31_COCMI|nr:uncharacterized protein COCMIDRAFT_30220 [Bipolaris oryzae ATCC 44560]EUC40936.1 hypothetical protein COCMIDRAFT_30220 [Bipolaris oryzae ATCC 44560]